MTQEELDEIVRRTRERETTDLLATDGKRDTDFVPGDIICNHYYPSYSEHFYGVFLRYESVGSRCLAAYLRMPSGKHVYSHITPQHKLRSMTVQDTVIMIARRCGSAAGLFDGALEPENCTQLTDRLATLEQCIGAPIASELRSEAHATWSRARTGAYTLQQEDNP